MLSFTIMSLTLSIVLLNVLMLSVFMLIVVAPFTKLMTFYVHYEHGGSLSLSVVITRRANFVLISLMISLCS